jgi:hypothetical protein
MTVRAFPDAHEITCAVTPSTAFNITKAATLKWPRATPSLLIGIAEVMKPYLHNESLCMPRFHRLSTHETSTTPTITSAITSSMIDWVARLNQCDPNPKEGEATLRRPLRRVSSCHAGLIVVNCSARIHIARLRGLTTITHLPLAVTRFTSDQGDQQRDGLLLPPSA